MTAPTAGGNGFHVDGFHGLVLTGFVAVLPHQRDGSAHGAGAGTVAARRRLSVASSPRLLRHPETVSSRLGAVDI